MIKEITPLNMQEVKKTLGSVEESERKKLLESFIKKFSKIDAKKAGKMKQELEALEFLKMKAEQIVKIIDLLPEDASDLNKIFTDVSLSEDETNKILEVIKKNK